jgi:hypothetical protein
MNLRNEADKLRQEAKDILFRLLKLPEGFSSSEVDRFVDCVVSAAMLEVSATIQKCSRDN